MQHKKLIKFLLCLVFLVASTFALSATDQKCAAENMFKVLSDCIVKRDESPLNVPVHNYKIGNEMCTIEAIKCLINRVRMLRGYDFRRQDELLRAFILRLIVYRHAHAIDHFLEGHEGRWDELSAKEQDKIAQRLTQILQTLQLSEQYNISLFDYASNGSLDRDKGCLPLYTTLLSFFSFMKKMATTVINSPQAPYFFPFAQIYQWTHAALGSCCHEYVRDYFTVQVFSNASWGRPLGST